MTAAPELHTVTALGVWLWDPVADLPLADDALKVLAHPLDVPGDPTRAVTTPSGVRAFQGLAGLRRVEYPLPGEDPLRAPVQTGAFAVTVEDPAGRFLDLTVELLAPQPGLAGIGSPIGDRIFLFSAPTRRFPPGVAVLRADIVDRATGEPAAWARVDAVVAGRRHMAIASETGAVAIGFPYPGFAGAPPPSPPPGTAGTPPALQAWPVSVEVRHEPDALEFPLRDRAPELGSIARQARVAIWPQSSGNPVEALAVELRFGTDLVLRTAGEPALQTGGTSP